MQGTYSSRAKKKLIVWVMRRDTSSDITRKLDVPPGEADDIVSAIAGYSTPS